MGELFQEKTESFWNIENRRKNVTRHFSPSADGEKSV